MEYVGKRVKVTQKDGSTYEGYIHSMDENTGKLTLHKVINEDGRKLPGIQHFFGDELKEVYTFENELPLSSKDAKENLVERRNGKKLLHPKCVPAHLQKMRDFNPESVLLTNIAREKMEDTHKQDNKSSDYDSSSDPEALERGTEAPYIVINKMDRRYYDAIDAVLNCAVVGLAMQGVCVGRSGEVCWVQFATDRNVFLFDVLELSAECFEEGIKNILENPDVLKVTHDCRLISDYLHHRHNIRLINGFDTQVADVFVYRLFRGGDWPRYVNGLADCALNNLGLDPEQVFSLKTREGLKKNDEETWAKRPIKPQLLDALYKNVVHLRPLRQVLIEKMMAEYVAGVDVYLSQVRDSSMKDAKTHQPNLLPMAFEGLKKLVPRFDSTCWNRNRAHQETSNVKGFRDNILAIRDPKVIISHDSIWHQGPYKGQYMFEEVASQLKFVKEDGTPFRDENQKTETEAGVSESRKLSSTSSPSATNPYSSPVTYSSPVKRATEPRPGGATTKVPVSGAGIEKGPAPQLKRLSEMEETLKMQRIMKETGEPSAGMLIRSVLKQTDPKKLEDRAEDNESYTFRPAGVMIHSKANEKTTCRRQREVDELELEMAQYVMEKHNQESSQQEEFDYDDWGGTRNKPLVTSQENINRDTILNQYLAMIAKENAEKEVEQPQQQDTASTYTLSGGFTTPQTLNGGFTTPQTLNGGFTTPQTLNGGFTTPQTLNGGFTTPQTLNGGFTTPQTLNGGFTTPQGFSAVRSPSSSADEAVGSHSCPQQTRHYSEFQYKSSTSDNGSAQGSDTLTQGSIGSSMRTSTRSGHLPQMRCLYRGQISSKPQVSQNQHEAPNLNTSLPPTFESPKSNQREKSVSLPTTPCVAEETSGNCVHKAKPAVSGAPSNIANLSKLVTLLAKSSIRSVPSSDQKPSKDLNNSSGASAPFRPARSVQETSTVYPQATSATKSSVSYTVNPQATSATKSSVSYTVNPQATSASKSSRYTTCVQKPSSNKDISQITSPLGKEMTQNSSKRSGSVTEALSSTNSKLQRLKILAGVLKKSES